jgi:2'-5' RNA ligase
MRRSAVVVPVAEAARLVDGWRERTWTAKPSAGVPAHVTLVFPFVWRSATKGVAALRELTAGHHAFRFELGGTSRFPGVL